MKRLLLPLLAALALPTAVNAEKMFNAIDTCAMELLNPKVYGIAFIMSLLHCHM
jgi:hypothetical protein